MSSPEVSVILPCRDEAEAVGDSVAEACAALSAHHINGEVIVADSSSDNSAALARGAGATVVVHGRDGYGTALREGIACARGKVIVYGDADGTYDFREIPALLAALKDADLALGTRRNGSIAHGAMPFLHRWLGTPVLNLLLFIFFGIRTSDSQTGFRALRRTTFDMLDLKTTGMEFATEMLVKAKQHDFRMVEVPTPYRRRRGNSKLRPYRDGFAHVKYILLQAPLAWYFTAGSIFLAVGLLGLTRGTASDAFLNSATVKILFPILGLQTLFLGLFAKTYLATKFGETVPFLTRFYARFRMKTAMMLGAIFLVVPTVLKLAGAAVPFDPLLVSAICGVQIIFNSFTLGTLSIK